MVLEQIRQDRFEAILDAPSGTVNLLLDHRGILGTPAVMCQSA
jgi:hypothetical protein